MSTEGAQQFLCSEMLSQLSDRLAGAFSHFD